MMYDWEKINDEFVSDEFKPLKSLAYNFPTYELFNIDITDFNQMKHMISCNIIIPITFEEENGEYPNGPLKY